MPVAEGWLSFLKATPNGFVAVRHSRSTAGGDADGVQDVDSASDVLVVNGHSQSVRTLSPTPGWSVSALDVADSWVVFRETRHVSDHVCQPGDCVEWRLVATNLNTGTRSVISASTGPDSQFVQPVPRIASDGNVIWRTIVADSDAAILWRRSPVNTSPEKVFEGSVLDLFDIAASSGTVVFAVTQPRPGVFIAQPGQAPKPALSEEAQQPVMTGARIAYVTGSPSTGMQVRVQGDERPALSVKEVYLLTGSDALLAAWGVGGVFASAPDRFDMEQVEPSIDTRGSVDVTDGRLVFATIATNGDQLVTEASLD